MNERIRELLKQSGLWYVSPREDLMNDFAELLVSECAEVCEELSDNAWSQGEVKHSERCAGAIKRHFGVE